jgi:hypothetical protein
MGAMNPDHLPHTLVPLCLAVIVVRERIKDVVEPGSAEPDAIATFIASVLPIYEYGGPRPPRLLMRSNRHGVFRDGGRVLEFLDGRPSKHLLAVKAEEIPCIVEMIKHPDRAESIRRKAVQSTARRLVTLSRELRKTCADLNQASHRLQAKCIELERRRDVTHAPAGGAPIPPGGHAG